MGWKPIKELGAGSSIAALTRDGIYWDEIVSIESLGKRDTYHIQVDPHHNYVNRDGIVSHNTITQGVRAILSAAAVPGLNILYVSPSFKQTKRFSRKCVDQLCKDSPFVRSQLMDPSLVWSIENKPFKNGASITLHYAFHTADRSRGEAMDFLEVDEIQDVNVDSLPVLEQTLVHSKPPPDHPEWAPFFKRKLYTGTPKSLDNTMEHFWRESTQCVWVVPCRACRSWGQLTEKSIGKEGTICAGLATRTGGYRGTCGKPVDPREGMWHALKPDASILGFHVSQLMAPRVEWGSHGWIRWKKDILDPYEGRSPGYDKIRFYNEILGLPCESALRAVSQADVMACCDEGWNLVPAPTDLTRSRVLTAGVDWGETRSRTVLTIGGRFGDGRWAPVFVRIYGSDECDPPFLVEDILKWSRLFGVSAIGCDVGHGFGMNSQLVREFGIERIFPIRYLGQASPRLAFAGRNRWEWRANRGTLLGDFFMAIKQRRLKFPKWSEWEPYAKDLLAVFLEFSGRKRDLFYSHTDPDDLVHSFVYAMAAEEISKGSFVVQEEES
jgi:hypothetical protein